MLTEQSSHLRALNADLRLRARFSKTILHNPSAAETVQLANRQIKVLETAIHEIPSLRKCTSSAIRIEFGQLSESLHQLADNIFKQSFPRTTSPHMLLDEERPQREADKMRNDSSASDTVTEILDDDQELEIREDVSMGLKRPLDDDLPTTVQEEVNLMSPRSRTRKQTRVDKVKSNEISLRARKPSRRRQELSVEDLASEDDIRDHSAAEEYQDEQAVNQRHEEIDSDHDAQPGLLDRYPSTEKENSKPSKTKAAAKKKTVKPVKPVTTTRSTVPMTMPQVQAWNTAAPTSRDRDGVSESEAYPHDGQDEDDDDDFFPSTEEIWNRKMTAPKTSVASDKVLGQDGRYIDFNALHKP